jgi:hypothetical protein
VGYSKEGKVPNGKQLKVGARGPTLWLQRRLHSRLPLHPTLKGPAVLSPEKPDQARAAPTPVTAIPAGWVREVKLKARYAAEYPGIVPEVWMPVRQLSAKLMERVRAGRREGRHTRTFDPTHFVFRGGDPGPRPRAARTRSTDAEV